MLVENKILPKEITELFDDVINSSYQKIISKEKKIIHESLVIAFNGHDGQVRKSGEAYIHHPLEVAKIVAKDIGLDYISIASAILHDTVEDTEVTLEDLDVSHDIINGTQEGTTTPAGVNDDNVNDNSFVIDTSELHKSLKEDGDDDDTGNDIRAAELTLTQTITTPIQVSDTNSGTSSSSKAKGRNVGSFTKPRNSNLFASKARVVGKLGAMSKRAKAGDKSMSPRRGSNSDSNTSTSKSPSSSPRQENKKSLDENE